MEKKKEPPAMVAEPPVDPASHPKSRSSPLLAALLGAAIGGLVAFFLARYLYRFDREPEKNLAAVRAELAQAKTRAEDIRGHLLQEYFFVLSRGAMAKDMAYLEYGRKGLLELGPRTIPSCRELALRTRSDDLKLQLVSIMGQWKEPEAASAILDVYQAQDPASRAVKEAAISTLAKLGIRQSATCLGKIIREEKDESMRSYALPYYKPYAHADPQGLPDDPKILQTIQRGDREGELSAEIRRLDPGKDADRARLQALARSEATAGVRLSAIQKLVLKSDDSTVSLLSDVIQAAGKDEGGVLRTTCLAHLCRVDRPDALEAIGRFLTSPDAALRKSTLSVLTSSGRKAHLQVLTRVETGDTPNDERQMAKDAIQKIQALEARTGQEPTSPGKK